MTAPVSQVLSEAADLLEKPGAFMQGDFCDSDDGGARPDSIQFAECFCTYGAIAKVLGISGPAAEMWGSQNEIDELFGPCGVVDFNDSHEQHEVVAKVREVAAALAKEQGR